MFWVYRTRQELAVVEARSWLGGLAAAVEQLGLDEADLPRVSAEVHASGVRIAGPSGEVLLLARPYPDDQPLPPTAGALIGASADEWDAPLEDARVAVLVDSEQPLPTAPDGLAETIFEATAAIAEAPSAADAAERALDVLRELVPHEASSVLYAGLDTPAFAFLAVRGPRTAPLAGVELPLGEGVVGHVHDTGIAVRIRDLGHSARHLRALDVSTGYRPRALLAVPLRTDDGNRFGVMELLDSADRFEDWHVEVLDEVARALADRLAADLVS